MGQLRNAIRAYAIEDSSPARVLTRLNHMMCRLEQGQFASAIVALWNERTGTLLRANAGHPPMLRCGRPRQVRYLSLLKQQGDRLLGVTRTGTTRRRPKFCDPVRLFCSIPTALSNGADSRATSPWTSWWPSQSSSTIFLRRGYATRLSTGDIEGLAKRDHVRIGGADDK